MIHVQATIPFLPANAPVGTQVPGFSTMPENILQYWAEFSPTRVSAPDISILSDISCYFINRYSSTIIIIVVDSLMMSPSAAACVR